MTIFSFLYKKTFLSLFLIFIFCCFTKKAKATNDTIPPFFQQIIDVTPYNDFARAVKSTADGGFIIVGFSGNDIYTREGLIVKVSMQGNIQWSKVIGVHSISQFSDIDEVFEQVEVMEDGSYLVVGTANGYYPFILKFSYTGEVLWQKKLTVPEGWRGNFHGISKAENNMFLLSGFLRESFYMKDFILKISSDGDLIWGKEYKNGSHILYLRTKVHIYDDGYLLIGNSYTRPTPTDEKQTKIFFLKVNYQGEITTPIKTLSYTQSDYDGLDGQDEWEKTPTGFIFGGNLGHRADNDAQKKAFIISTDENANVLWAKTYADTTLYIIEGVEFIKKAISGNYLLNFIDGYLQNDVYDLFPLIDQDESITFAKIDPNGNLLWNRLYGGTAREPYFFMDMTQEGGAVIAGSSFSFTSDTDNSALYVLKTDTAGYAGTCQQSSLDIIVEDIEIEEDTFSLEVADFGELVPVEMPVVDVDVTAIDLCPPAEVTHLDYTLCAQDEFHGLPIGQDTILSEAQLTVDGLDSFIYHHLQVLPTVDTFLSAAIAAGDSVLIGTRTYTETGNYLDTLTAANGCDSLVYLDLTVLTSVAEVEEELAFWVFPNPFGQQVSMAIDLPKQQAVAVKVLDVYGRTVAVLEQGTLLVGRHEFSWEARGLPVGVYWVVFQSELGSFVQKVLKQ